MSFAEKTRKKMRRMWSESDTEMIMSVVDEVVAEHKQKLQQLREGILDFLNDFDVVKFAETQQINMDNWLKSKLFTLISDFRTEIIMRFEEELEK